jgi:hypothetical protein
MALRRGSPALSMTTAAWNGDLPGTRAVMGKLGEMGASPSSKVRKNRRATLAPWHSGYKPRHLPLSRHATSMRGIMPFACERDGHRPLPRPSGAGCSRVLSDRAHADGIIDKRIKMPDFISHAQNHPLSPVPVAPYRPQQAADTDWHSEGCLPGLRRYFCTRNHACRPRTDRRIDRLSDDGHSIRQIAIRLGLSTTTVWSHRKALAAAYREQIAKPYRVPRDVLHVVSWSGGKDSSALVVWVLEHLPQADTHYVFCDTGWESFLTYRFIAEINRRLLGGKLIVLRSRRYGAPRPRPQAGGAFLRPRPASTPRDSRSPR